MELAKKKCVPCEAGARPFSREKAAGYLKQVSGWKLAGGKKIEKRITFRDFMELMKFANELAAVAEKEGHHPDFSVSYNKLDIRLWTHAINGLSENDFIMAAKIDGLLAGFKDRE